MYFRLAFRNVKRQLNNYLIYFITVSLTIALMFSLNNAIYSDVMQVRMEDNPDLKGSMIMISVFIAIVISFILGYATSFMLKLRKREFGTYLILGMSRNNILGIFLSEIIVMCTLGLFAGMFLGIFIYQGVMAIICNLMDMNFGGSAYSYEGMRFTFFMVLGMFVLSSLTSAWYLRKTSIYKLIHGDKVVSKGVKHPLIWAIVDVISAASIVYGVYGIYKSFLDILNGVGGVNIMMYMMLLVAAIVLFHVALAKSLVYILMKNKKRSNLGTNRFVLRQLSKKLSADAVLMGIIAFLISFAVVSTNISLEENVMLTASINEDYPYDMVTDKMAEDTEHIKTEDAEQIVERYTDITQKYTFTTYTDSINQIADISGSESDYLKAGFDRYIALSDMNEILINSNREPIELNGNQFAIIENNSIEGYDFTGKSLEINGVDYKYCETAIDYFLFSNAVLVAVIPDEACRELTVASKGAVYNFSSDNYDAKELHDELSYIIEGNVYGQTDSEYNIKGYIEYEMKSSISTLILCMMYISFVFVLLAMAVLALKTLTGISDDAKKYDILDKLGADKKERSRALLKQTSMFFFLPYIMPILSSIPVALLMKFITDKVGYTRYSSAITKYTIIIAFVLTLVYVLYYAATYLAAKKNVINNK